MYTKRKLAEKAFQAIGLASYVFDIEPEEMQLAVENIDLMLAEWEPKLKLGFLMPQNPEDSDPDQPSGLPDYANSAVILNGGLRLASTFGKPVPAGLPLLAKNAYNELLAKGVRPVPMQYVGQLPKGAGNRRWGVQQQPYFHPVDNALPTDAGGNLEFLEP